MYKRSIKIEEAKQGMKLAEEVYVHISDDRPAVMAAREGMELDDKLITMLARHKVKTVDVYMDAPEIKKAVVPQAEEAVPWSQRTDLPPEKLSLVKSVIKDELKEEAVNSVRKLFNCFDRKDGTLNKTTAYQCVDNIEQVVGDLVNVFSEDADSLVHINDLKSFDDYTYHHSLSVSMLAMATGRELGFDNNELFRLGRCAMMHDVGKQLIPLNIINKKGKLSEKEFEAIKNHSSLGASSLKAINLGDIEMWNGIMYHHEKVNGTGYPRQLKGKDIPLFSKIISVADVYDAVTSYRAYRNPMLPSEAFEVIGRDIGAAFELEIVKAFFAKLDLYPVNSVLELSDGRLGIVIDCDDVLRQRLRPAVRIWGSDSVVYLAAETDIGIVAVLHPGDLPAGTEFM